MELRQEQTYSSRSWRNHMLAPQKARQSSKLNDGKASESAAQALPHRLEPELAYSNARQRAYLRQVDDSAGKKRDENRNEQRPLGLAFLLLLFLLRLALG